MKPFCIFFENFEVGMDPIKISPKTIYNFYFLYTFLQTRGTDQFSQFIIDEFSQNIKKLYVNIFSTLIERQLKKYNSRSRTDADFKLKETHSPQELHILMQKTFRSDMKRRNDRWVDLAKWLVELSTANNTKSIFFAIDRINNTTHNTQENILSKFENSAELMVAFDKCHEMQRLEDFRPFITREYAKLL